jgi:hypothetical protein
MNACMLSYSVLSYVQVGYGCKSCICYPAYSTATSWKKIYQMPVQLSANMQV